MPMFPGQFPLNYSLPILETGPRASCMLGYSSSPTLKLQAPEVTTYFSI